MSRLAKKLIVTADDFGASSTINQAVERAHHCGILTSASLIVTGVMCDQAVAIARSSPSLAVGIHVILLQGKSVLPPSEIAPLVNAAGRFRDNPISAGFIYFFSKRIRMILGMEIEAQIQKFLSTGLTPTHIDGHHHLHLHPAVFPVLLSLAQRYSIPAIRLPREPLYVNLKLDPRSLPRKVAYSIIYRLLCQRARKLLQGSGVRFPDRFFGLLNTGHITKGYFLKLIDHIESGITEIGLHPALAPPPELARWAPSYSYREEFEVLMCPCLKEKLSRNQIELVSYRVFQGGCNGL